MVFPNSRTLPWELDNGVKVFRLVAEPVRRQFAPGLEVNCWGYNGESLGPAGDPHLNADDPGDWWGTAAPPAERLPQSGVAGRP